MSRTGIQDSFEARHRGMVCFVQDHAAKLLKNGLVLGNEFLHRLDGGDSHVTDLKFFALDDPDIQVGDRKLGVIHPLLENVLRVDEDERAGFTRCDERERDLSLSRVMDDESISKVIRNLSYFKVECLSLTNFHNRGN